MPEILHAAFCLPGSEIKSENMLDKIRYIFIMCQTVTYITSVLTLLNNSFTGAVLPVAKLKHFCI
jgi:hypothetical protein